MNSALSLRPLVHPSVTPFSQDGLITLFCFFCMELVLDFFIKPKMEEVAHFWTQNQHF